MSHSHLTAALSSKFQLTINNALNLYRKRTKNDLLLHPLTSQLQVCNSPADILAVLQQQVQGLDQSRNCNERWTKWLSPTVDVLYTFSETLGECIGGVSLRTKTCPISALIYTWQVFSPAKVIFGGVGVLLSVRILLPVISPCGQYNGYISQAAKDVQAARDTLFDAFERIECFFRRLENYTEMRPTIEMVDIITLIMAEVLSILGIMTKDIRQG